jgi:excinuclease UvrABC ATPase subunit
MSFFIRSAPVRVTNTAELMFNNSTKAAEVRKNQITATIPTIVSNMLMTIKNYSITTRSPMFYNFKFTEDLCPTCTKLDTVSDIERRTIMDEIKKTLEDPVKNGFVVIVSEDASEITVDWSVPVVLAIVTTTDVNDVKV